MTDRDFLSRDKIRNDVHHNYFVEAGAGSGKTSVLVDRMVSMVNAGIDISKICAITFTKAAAGEFYARFQKKLSELHTPEAEKALNDIDLCFMGTIDGFCNMVLSEHPMEAGVPSDAGVIDSEELSVLLKEEYSQIIQGACGEEIRKKALRAQELTGNAQEVFLSSLPRLLETRNSKLNFPAPSSEEPDALFTKEKQTLLSFLKLAADHEDLFVTDKGKPKEAWNILPDVLEDLEGTWNRKLDAKIKSLGKLAGLRVVPWYDSSAGVLGMHFSEYFEPHFTRDKLAWYEVSEEGIGNLCAQLRDYLYSVVMDFLHDSVLSVTEDLKKQGKLSFTDYLIYLRDMLKEDVKKEGKLIRHIGERHSFFLVDEFQDTNPVQAEIIFYLTAKAPVENWRECVPREGSLFIVGDPKQSIYRFQNADVTSFKKVKDLFEGEVGEVLELTRNFRSNDEMCSWFNQAFAGLLPEDTDIQSAFKPIPTGEKAAYRGTLAGAYAYVTEFERSVAERRDPEQVAGIIQKIVHDPKITIQDRDAVPGVGCEPRRAGYKDFMVITPGKTHLGIYTRKFVEEGVPFRVEGKIVFAECPALVAVSRVFSAVADPFSREKVFSACMLSHCGLEREAVMELTGRVTGMSPVSVLMMLVDELQIFRRAGTENAEYLYYAAELLRSAEVSGKVITLKDSAAFLQSLIDDPKKTERCIQLTRNDDCVHIANLHKVKGLEKPIVILADPDSEAHGAESRVDYSALQPESWIFSLGNGIKTLAYPEEEEKENEVLAAERIRLLYVAATRAGNALIMADSYTKQGRYASNPWAPLLETENIRPFEPDWDGGEKKPAEAGDFNRLYREAQEGCVLNNRTSEKASYELKRPSLEKLNRVTETDEEYDAAEEEKRERRPGNAAVLGTLVHRLMEVLVTSKNTVSREKAIRDILMEYEAEPSVYEEMLRSVGDTITAGGFDQKGGAPKDILKELLSAEEVYCEYPFCFRAADKAEIWNGVMDVVYKKDGKWHIIDYKTNADDTDLEGEYRKQLDAYITAFRECEGLEADARIYHIGV